MTEITYIIDRKLRKNILECSWILNHKERAILQDKNGKLNINTKIRGYTLLSRFVKFLPRYELVAHMSEKMVECIRSLLENGADPFPSTGQQPLTILLVQFYETEKPTIYQLQTLEILTRIELIEPRGRSINCYTFTTLINRALKFHWVRVIEILLKAGLKPDYDLYHGTTTMFTKAIELWNDSEAIYEILSLLLQYGADPNARSGREPWLIPQFSPLQQLVKTFYSYHYFIKPEQKMRFDVIDLFVRAKGNLKECLDIADSLVNKLECHGEYPERLRFIAYRSDMSNICIALQDLELPALITLAIIDEFDPQITLIPMHYKWDLIVLVKHFRDKN